MTCKRPSRHGIAALCLITLILATHALTHSAAARVLTGPSTLPHLQENLGGWGWTLSEGDLAALEPFFWGRRHPLAPRADGQRASDGGPASRGEQGAFRGQDAGPPVKFEALIGELLASFELEGITAAVPWSRWAGTEAAGRSLPGS